MSHETIESTAPTHRPRTELVAWTAVVLAVALHTAACESPRRLDDGDAGATADAARGAETDAAWGSGRDAATPDPREATDAGRTRPDRDGGPPRDEDAGTPPGDAGMAVACRTDADCEAVGGGVCDEGGCVHIAECPAPVVRASCAARTTSARWCVGGRNKLAKLSRLMCTEDHVSVRVYDVGSACGAGSTCASGQVCEDTLTGTGRAFCATPCAADRDCGAEGACLAFSTGWYCGRPIGEVEDVFCSTTNVDATFGPAFAAPRFFDAGGAPIEIRGDLQEVLDLDPELGCP